MNRILTCTWAPTAMGGPSLTAQPRESSLRSLSGTALHERLTRPVEKAEELGIDYLLVAQRWWGTADEIEGSSYDCLAMTAYYAATTKRIKLITAIHPGFFLPAPIAKWGATIDRLTEGRWSINVTSGWHEQEFGMYGAELLPHDDRYRRSSEFIQVLRGAWQDPQFSFSGRYYRTEGLRLEPRPVSPQLEVFQGGQSPAAAEMAAQHSDWVFLNGGSPEKIAKLIELFRTAAAKTRRDLRFALYAIPLCRPTEREAQREIDEMVRLVRPDAVEKRRQRVSGAHGMWEPSDDPLTLLDSNEGYASRLIGSPSTILKRMREFHDLGIDCFHLTLHDDRFNTEVLPRLSK
jgi:dimethylsulfone monooxygenase